METPTSTSRGGPVRSSRAEREKEDRAKANSTHRSTRYKEKYQAMRERFERVNAAREAYLRDLELAGAKIRKIQEENDLLLDAMLANPPPSLSPSQAPDPGHYQSPLSSHPAVPSQPQYTPMDRPGYQPAPAPPLPTPLFDYDLRLAEIPSLEFPAHRFPENPELMPPLLYGRPRQHQHPPHAPNDGRDGTGHHYSGSSSRSRGPPPEVDQRG